MKKLLIILSILVLVLPVTTSAADVATDCKDYCADQSQDSPPGQTCICNPLVSEDFEVIITNIINFIFNIAIVLVPLMIVIAGFLFVTAGGNLEQTKRAKNIIIWTVVGFLIVLLARGIMGVIMNLLGVS